MKASIVSSWRLAEAQEQLCSLGVHSSESLEQERARTRACPAELTHTEEEWRRKESVLGRLAGSHSPVLGAVSSWDVFDKVRKKNRNTFTLCAVLLLLLLFFPLTVKRLFFSLRVSLMSRFLLWSWIRTNPKRLFSSLNRRSGTLVSDSHD